MFISEAYFLGFEMSAQPPDETIRPRKRCDLSILRLSRDKREQCNLREYSL